MVKVKAFDNPKFICCQGNLYNSHQQLLKLAFPEIPSSEKVIVSYRCKYVKTSEHPKSRGRVYVTQNFVLFKGKDGTFTVTIPIHEIRKVETSRSQKTGLYPAATIFLSNESRKLSHLYKRNDFVNIVNYLTSHTPIYVSLPSKREKVELPASNLLVRNDPDSQSSPTAIFLREESRIKSMVPEVRASSDPMIGGRWSFDDDDERARNYTAVDVKTAGKVEKLADEILQIQIDNRNKIEGQANQIDQIERDVSEVENSLKLGNHMANEMRNSPLPAISGAVGKRFHRKLGAQELIDRSVQELHIYNQTDISILLFCRHRVKLRTRQYYPAVISFFEHEVVISRTNSVYQGESDDNESTDSPELVEKRRFHYAEISLVFLEDKPGHIGIRYSCGDVEMFSSYTQLITNEIVLRSSQDIPVVFSVNAKVFDYGNPLLSRLNPHDDREGNFSRPSFQMTETIMANVPRSVRKDLEHQENALERAQGAVDTLLAIDRETQQELSRQVKQLDEVHKKADKVAQLSGKVNHKVYSQI